MKFSLSRRGKVFVIALAIIAGLLGSGFLCTCFFLFKLYVIPQNGMYPTLPAGSRFLAYRQAYSSINDIKKGDIIVFKREVKGRNYVYVWRVMALPHDIVSIRRDEVVINGKPLAREVNAEKDGFIIYQETNGDTRYSVAYQQFPQHKPNPVEQYRVSPNGVFVLGDNRYNAVDSTYFGEVSFKVIVGKKL